MGNSNIQTILNCPFLPQSLVAPADAAGEDFDALALTLTQAQADNATLQNQISALQAQIAAAANVKVFDGLELTPWTVAGGSAANSSGNTGVAGDAQSIPTDKNAFLQILPNGLAFANKYWYKNRPGDATKKTYDYEGLLMLPTAADCAASQAIELDIEQRISGTCFNVGFQWDFAEKVLRVWNRSASTPTVPHGWQSIGVSLARWAPLSWHSFKLEAHRDDSSVHYDAATVDGNRIDLSGLSFPAIQLNEPDCMNNALQLDANSAGAAYLMYIDQIRLAVA